MSETTTEMISSLNSPSLWPSQARFFVGFAVVSSSTGCPQVFCHLTLPNRNKKHMHQHPSIWVNPNPIRKLPTQKTVLLIDGTSPSTNNKNLSTNMSCAGRDKHHLFWTKLCFADLFCSPLFLEGLSPWVMGSMRHAIDEIRHHWDIASKQRTNNMLKTFYGTGSANTSKLYQYLPQPIGNKKHVFNIIVRKLIFFLLHHTKFW